MRLLEKLEKKGETQKTNKKNPSGNFKSKLQFQGMNPINISFKIGFFFVVFFFQKCKNPTEESQDFPRYGRKRHFLGMD